MKKIIMVLIGCLLLGACTNEQDSQVLKQNEQKAQELYEKAVALKDAQDYSGAILKYEKLLRNYSRSSLSSKAKAEKKFCQRAMRRKKEEKRLALFSGYQNIKFGMSEEQVKELFDGKLRYSDEDYWSGALKNKHIRANFEEHHMDFPGDLTRVGKDNLIYYKNHTEISFWFSNNELYEIDVKPSIERDYCSNYIQIAIDTLVKKYGKYTISRANKNYNEVPNVPIKYYRWSYGDKEVMLVYVASLCISEIRYIDRGLIRKAEEQRNVEKLKKLREYSQQKQQELEWLI